MTSAIAENAFVLRNRNSLTQDQVADVLGVTQATYWRLEKGYSEFKSSQIVTLAKYYGVTIAELYGETSEAGNANNLVSEPQGTYGTVKEKGHRVMFEMVLTDEEFAELSPVLTKKLQAFTKAMKG